MVAIRSLFRWTSILALLALFALLAGCTPATLPLVATSEPSSTSPTGAAPAPTTGAPAPTGQAMTQAEAQQIASKNTECANVGPIVGTPLYNENSKTWWFDLGATKAGCAPACVVSANRAVEVNWRCTGGAVPPPTSAAPVPTEAAPATTTAAPAPTGQAMTQAEAQQIASKNTECANVGPIVGTPLYNENSKTWWFELGATKAGCAPACVVSANRAVEVNWRCTGGVAPTPTGQAMTEAEARQIAGQNSDCTAAGSQKDTAIFNENSNTWWIDLAGSKPGCAPACVVNAATKSAEVNWRCTGLLQATPTAQAMSEAEAQQIASKNTECANVGPIVGTPLYNENSKTWWFDLGATKAGCAPACVVSANRAAEVNWRCTGLQPQPTNTAQP